MKKFYNVFSNEKVTTMLSQLTWSHYLLLLSLNNYDEIIYYINISKNNSLTQRQLQEKIKNSEYQRITFESRNKLIKNEMLKPNDLIHNPIKIKNVNNYENISEKILQRLILEDIPGFLKELGSGFTFVDNEYKVKLSDRYNYVDLLLYNIKYKCYVVVELKITELKKEHTGQIMTYMNYIDKNVKTIDKNDTVGIIICKQDNQYVIKYCSDDRIIAREYELV
jgi:predicted nuclease of restriction endonuclease-like (RecB) superfamily